LTSCCSKRTQQRSQTTILIPWSFYSTIPCKIDDDEEEEEEENGRQRKQATCSAKKKKFPSYLKRSDDHLFLIA
jgi:hypothetical protein